MTRTTAAGTAWIVVAILGSLFGLGAVIGAFRDGDAAIVLMLMLTMAFGLPVLFAGGILVWKSADVALLASLYAFGVGIAAVTLAQPAAPLGLVVFGSIGVVSAMAARDLHAGVVGG